MWLRDFKDRPNLDRLRRIDQKLARQDQAMQRAKHAERRKDTREKIILGGLVIKAGAGGLPEDELVEALSDYMQRRESAGPRGAVKSTKAKPD